MRKGMIVIIALILAIGAIIMMFRYESTLAACVAYSLIACVIYNVLK